MVIKNFQVSFQYQNLWLKAQFHIIILCGLTKDLTHVNSGRAHASPCAWRTGNAVTEDMKFFNPGYHKVTIMALCSLRVTQQTHYKLSSFLTSFPTLLSCTSLLVKGIHSLEKVLGKKHRVTHQISLDAYSVSGCILGIRIEL